jgi:hypothetical protein
MAEQWRVYAFGIMASRPGNYEQDDVSIFYQMPGITFARSKQEAVAKAFKKAHRNYPESEGYSNHQAVALEVTHDFLDLADRLSPLPKKDPRRGEFAIRGEAVETEEEIAIDVDADVGFR